MFNRFIDSSNALANTWGRWMIHSLLDAALVFLVVSILWLIIRRKASPQLGYLLFLLIPLKLFIPLEIAVPEKFVFWTSAASTFSSTTEITFAPVPQAERVEPAVEQRASSWQAVPPPIFDGGEPSPRIGVEKNPLPSPPAKKFTISAWLMLTWLLGIFALTTKLIFAQIHFRSRVLGTATAAHIESPEFDFEGLLARIGIRRPIRLVESDRVSSPAIWGLFHPTLILPRGIRQSLTDVQLEWVLLHELAHVRRRDLAVDCFQRLAAILHFINPAVWLANRTINRLREFACDDIASAFALGTPVESGEAFLSVVRYAASAQRKPEASLEAALGVFESTSRSSCFQRMARLLDVDRRRTIKLGLGSLCVLLLTAAIALPQIRAEEKKNPPLQTAEKQENTTATAAETKKSEIETAAAPLAASKIVEKRESTQPNEYEIGRYGLYATANAFNRDTKYGINPKPFLLNLGSNSQNILNQTTDALDADKNITYREPGEKLEKILPDDVVHSLMSQSPNAVVYTNTFNLAKDAKLGVTPITLPMNAGSLPQVVNQTTVASNTDAGLIASLPTEKQDKLKRNTPDHAVADRKEENKSDDESVYKFNVIIAKHVMLLEGKKIITWPEIEEIIAKQPNPSQTYPGLFVTRNGTAQGRYTAAKKEMVRLYDKYKLIGFTQGAVSPQNYERFDSIRTADDLKPDESLRVEGTIVDPQGKPIEDAEILLVTPRLDEFLPSGNHSINLVEGRIYKSMEENVVHSDAKGYFTIYPPKSGVYRLVALHPDLGFNHTDGDAFAKEHKITLLPWADLECSFADEGEKQTAELSSRIPQRDELPEISISQDSQSSKAEKSPFHFHFTRIPPIVSTTILHGFSGEEGTRFCLPGASFDLLPKETRRIDIGPLSEQQRVELKRMREESHRRSEQFKAVLNKKKESAAAADAKKPVADDLESVPVQSLVVERDGKQEKSLEAVNNSAVKDQNSVAEPARSRSDNKEAVRFKLHAQEGVISIPQNDYYMKFLPLKDKPLENLKAEPKYHSKKPLYGELELGVGPNNKVAVVVDEAEGMTTRFYVDCNRDRDLTNDGLNDNSVFTIDVPYPSGSAPYSLDLFRLSERPDFLGYRSNTHREGEIELEGKRYKIVIQDDNFNGRFNDPEQDILLIDVDQDGALDSYRGVTGDFSSAEIFKLNEPFNIFGKVWEAASVSPDGMTIALRPSAAKAVMKPHLNPGNIAPDFTLTGFDGKPITLSRTAAESRYVVVHFWNATSNYSQADFRNLRKLYAQYKKQGLQILGITENRDPKDIRKIVKRFSLTYPQLMDEINADLNVKDLYRVQGYSQTYLLDKNMTIVARGGLHGTGLRGADLGNKLQELLGQGDEQAAAQAEKEAVEAEKANTGVFAEDSSIPQAFCNVPGFKLMLLPRPSAWSNEDVRAAALHLPYVYILHRTTGGTASGNLFIVKIDTGPDGARKATAVREVPNFCDGTDLVIKGDTLLSTQAGALTVYSLSDPSNPKLMQNIRPEQSAEPKSIVWSNGNAFLLGSGRFSVFDVSNSSSPRFLTTQPQQPLLYNGCVMGKYLYASSKTKTDRSNGYGISVYDISKASEPQDVGFVESSDLNHQLLPVDSNRLICTTTTTAVLYSLDNPLKPASIGNPVKLPMPSGRTAAMLSANGRSFLIVNGAIYAVGTEKLDYLGNFNFGGNMDGIPYRAAVQDNCAAIPSSPFVVLLFADSRTPENPNQ